MFIEDHKKVGRRFTERHSNQYQLLVPSLASDHRILQLTEAAGNAIELGPFALQISWRQLLLQLEREFGPGEDPLVSNKLSNEYKSCGIDRLNLLTPFPGLQLSNLIEHHQKG